MKKTGRRGFFSTDRNTSSSMAYAITKAGVRWFLDSYPMPFHLTVLLRILVLLSMTYSVKH